MSLPVFLTDEAWETLEATLDFVKAQWGEKSEATLNKDIKRKLRLISTQPYMYKASSIDTRVRKGTISKQTSFFYEIKPDHILVLYFWDNRQQPIVD